MAVCSALLLAGWDVYRSVAPHGRCDLIAQRDTKTLRIEVTTGRFYRKGSPLSYPDHAKTKASWDVLAVVVPETGEIHWKDGPDPITQPA